MTKQVNIRGSHIVKPRVCVCLQLVWSNHCSIIVLVLGSSSTWSPHILEKNESRIKDHRTKDQGSVQNESNKLNKLIGMIDCSFTWFSQYLPYGQAKIRENKRNRHKYNRYNKHKYTKYWKSHTTLKKCQILSYQLLGQLLKTDSYRAGLLVHLLYSHEISKLSWVSVCDYVSDFRCNFKHESVFDDCRSKQQIFSCLISSLQIFTDVMSSKEK